MATQGNSSRLAQMQMKFQQKQQQERETKKVEMVGTINHDVGDGKVLGSSMGAGKVRQMFDQRRHRVEGIDKSYPLQPILPRSSPSTTTTTTSTRKTVTNVRKTVGAVRTTNGNVKSNVLTQKRISPNLKNNELNGNSRINGTTNLSNKLIVDDVDSYEDFLEDEKFPEFGISLEDDFLNQKLPNVGKLAALSLNNNNNKINNNSTEMESNINNNNNTVKLKPVVTKKILKDEPVKPLNGRRKIVPLIRSREESKSASEVPGVKLTTPKSTMKSRTPTSTAKSTPIASTKTTPVKQRTTTPPPNSAPCKMCGRYFNEDRIAKHETICVKTTTKKRKVFDVTKQRVQGTEAEVYVKKAAKNGGSKAGATKQPEGVKKSDWRRKHEEFIAAIRAAKEVKAHLAKGGKLSDLPPPPPSENPDYVQCPHCSRRFNETAAARHIPKCKDMQHNKPKAPVKKRV